MSATMKVRHAPRTSMHSYPPRARTALGRARRERATDGSADGCAAGALPMAIARAVFPSPVVASDAAIALCAVRARLTRYSIFLFCIRRL